MVLYYVRERQSLEVKGGLGIVSNVRAAIQYHAARQARSFREGVGNFWMGLTGWLSII